jgi:uncharacterized membrane protein YdjX (TVP38/TMEM64 family)
MRRILPFALLALLAAVFAAGQGFRGSAGFELTPESLRAYVAALGVVAPLAFVAIVTFRQALLLPSAIALTAGGLIFGPGLGALLGGSGILISATMLFFLARAMGGQWVHRRLHERFRAFEQRAEVAGPVVIGMMTGHPMGVMTPFHLAAGVSGIPAGVFLAVVAIAGAIRAATYAFLGAQLAEVGSVGFWLATAALVAVALLPLAHRGVRRRLFAGAR